MKWIRCEDEKPDGIGWVLGWRISTFGCWQHGWPEVVSWRAETGWIDDSGCEIVARDLTHWAQIVGPEGA